MYNGTSGDPQKANALKQALDYLDFYLDGSDYVAGDTLTIADFALLASVTHLEGVEWSYKVRRLFIFEWDDDDPFFWEGLNRFIESKHILNTKIIEWKIPVCCSDRVLLLLSLLVYKEITHK